MADLTPDIQNYIESAISQALTAREFANQVRPSPIAAHSHTGSDSARVGGEDLALVDSVMNNASLTKHGFLRKLSGNSTDFLKGDGTWGAGSPTTIYYDNSLVCAASGGTTQTTAYTNAGNLLFVAVSGFNTDAPTSAPTYDGVTMTLLDTTSSANNWITYLYYLRGPSLGTHNVSITMSGGSGDGAIAASYFNANIVSQPDTNAKSGPTTTTHYTQSLTTLTDKAWVIMCGNYGSGLALTPDAGTITRRVTGGSGVCYFADAGQIKTPVGSVTLGFTSSSQAFSGIIVSIKP